MDRSKNQQNVSSAGQMNYQPHPYQSTPLLSTSGQAIGPPSSAQHDSASHQFAFQQAQHLQHQQELQQLQYLWANQLEEIENTTDFKSHGLPLARVKKIMKSEEDIAMVSAEAPTILAKACETFILDLTLRSWMHTQEKKRRTLQKADISAALAKTDIYDFLCDIVPRAELKDNGLGGSKGKIPLMMNDFPYCHDKPLSELPHPVVGHSGMVVMENTADQATVYNHQQYRPQMPQVSPIPQMPFMTWPEDQTMPLEEKEE